MNTIFECSYLSFGGEIGHLLSTYATGENEGRGDHLKCAQAHTERGITPHMFVRTYTISFPVFVL